MKSEVRNDYFENAEGFTNSKSTGRGVGDPAEVRGFPLIRAQGLDRVYRSGTAGWNEGGSNCRNREQRCYRGYRQGIPWRRSKEHRPN
jgi:hypothetical protein